MTPLVRKLATEHGIDLGTVAGTGVGGRIRKQDVLDAARVMRDTGGAAAGFAADGAPQPAAPTAAPAAQSVAPAAPPTAPPAPPAAAHAAGRHAAGRRTRRSPVRRAARDPAATRDRPVQPAR